MIVGLGLDFGAHLSWILAVVGAEVLWLGFLGVYSFIELKGLEY